MVAAGRRRGRGANKGARAEALERLRALRRGERLSEGGGGGFQMKMEDPIYDTIDEDEYDALVTKRREDFRGFIVDDDGLGYDDQGHEEDWSQAGGVPSSDESEDDKTEKKLKKKKADKKEPLALKKPSPLPAAAALMGRQRLSSMFTSSVYKKRNGDVKANISSSDSIVDDVIAEFAPDEADRERRRQRKPVGSNSSIKSEKSLIGDANFVVRRPEITGLRTNGECLSDNFENERKDFNIEIGGDPVLLSCDSSVKGNVAKEESLLNDIEVKLEPLAKKEVYSLNAEDKEEKDPVMTATAGLEAARSAVNETISCFHGEESNPSLNCDRKPNFVVDSDGSLPFYILDAYEEPYGANASNVYLFGKVKVGTTYGSCCVIVKNMQRCVYAIPNGSLFHDDISMKLQRDAEQSIISPTALCTKLHEMASGLKGEIAKQLLQRNVSSFRMAPVKRSYAFERSDIPRGENYVLKINYPFKIGKYYSYSCLLPVRACNDPPLPSDLKGETFCALLGTHCSALELFLIKRKIKGPSWLSISKFSICLDPQCVSWCQFEVTIECPKDIKVSTSPKITAKIPTVIVTAVNLKTIINEKHNVNEIVSASVICCREAKVDTPTVAPKGTRPSMLHHFTIVRKLDGGIFPTGFKKKAFDRNSKAGSEVIISESSESALLASLFIRLHDLDPDVLVGHNISGFDLDVLLHRAQACRVPSSMWSKIGRFKRAVMPKLTKPNTYFASGVSPGIMSCTAGRLLCDTFLFSRDHLKEVSYSLTHLAKTQLDIDRKEIASHDIPQMFHCSESLMELVEYGEKDASLSMELMFRLSVLPLTRQLTNISGNLWGKTLQGARAQRVEYLLLHAFHTKKFIVPDKFSSHSKEIKVTKRKLNHGVEDNGVGDLDADAMIFENEFSHNNHGKAKKGPSYSGGLVLEPKRGLYDKYILLLDFNSLYPSIIQEYNICFTTVERSLDGSVPRLPSSKRNGVLPELLKNLIERRRMVKSWLKTASGLKERQLDIQQQALKLTANSMYGCLGFPNSRFHAKPLAELITLQGREILQSTVDLVQSNLNLEVIYGDTDSIMIYTGLDDIGKAKAIAGKVIQEVNKKYKCLEIDLDGLYKRMLLLKKKKYAAVKVRFQDGRLYEVVEQKGLDMVRRDWSLISKDMGNFCLSQILSGSSCEDVVESIHESLTKVQEDMRNGQIAPEKYIITKTLTKSPEAYPDAKNQPHVEVALRLKRGGSVTGCSAGDTVPYIVCCAQGNSSSTSTGIAQRARHPDELTRDNGNWIIDIDYYLAQQIHPVVSRLCESIQGTSPARLADCLGLDSSKFQRKSGEVDNDPSSSLLCSVDDENSYRGCEPLILSCPSCSGTFDCPTLFSFICSSISEKSTGLQANEFTTNFWRKLRCPKCPEEGNRGRMSPASIANQVKRQAEGFISTYYTGLMTCDDETCKYTTRGLNLRVLGDAERGTVCPNYPRCNGRLVRKYTEADLYKQLTCFCHVLDTVRCIDKLEAKFRIPFEKELVKIRPLVELAASTVQKIRDRSAYGWVQLKELTVTI